MEDIDKVAEHMHGVATDEYAQGEISDACARVIASWWSQGNEPLSMSFVSTGAITGTPDEVWHACGGDHYHDGHLTDTDRLALDFLGTYLQNREHRGPIEGWHELWL